MSDETKAIHNPDLYERMSEPRPLADIKADYDAFFEGVAALREKHRVRDVLVVTTLAVTDVPGTEAMMLVGFRGDSTLMTKLAAFALGQLRLREQREIDRIAAGTEVVK